MRIRRIVKFIVVIVGLIAALCVGFGIYILAYGQVDHATTSDVIIVLGAGARMDGSPTPAPLRRVGRAVALYKQGLAPWVLCTGGYTANVPTSEARACANAAHAQGVPMDAILLDEKSRSTEENAIESRKIMEARGLKTAVVVSDNFHLWRAEMLFHVQGLHVYMSPAQATTGPLSAWVTFTNTGREVMATGWYAFKTLLGLPITDIR